MAGFFSNWLSRLTKTNESTGQYGPASTPRPPQRNAERLDRITKSDQRHRSRRLDPYDVTDAETWDEITDADIIDEPIAEMGPMHTGELVYSPQSSCVVWYQYHLGSDNHEPLLYIGYKGERGGISAYAYQNVSVEEAESLHAAGSKGTWVWDNLRIRGTVFGYRKPYFFLDGISTAPRQWHEAGQESITRHGHIPPSGEPWTGYRPDTNYAGAKGGMGKKRGNSKPWNSDKGLGKK